MHGHPSAPCIIHGGARPGRSRLVPPDADEEAARAATTVVADICVVPAATGIRAAIYAADVQVFCGHAEAPDVRGCGQRTPARVHDEDR